MSAGYEAEEDPRPACLILGRN